MDTIFALASAQGRAGVSVLRISGKEALSVASRFCALPAPRTPALRRLVYEGDILDEALVLVFPEGQSFTGEPVVEFQVHGSVAVIRALLSCLSRQPEARLAEPGEFTKRAFDNNRLGLTQVEGLRDLIEAETELQRKLAQRSFSGEIQRIAEDWRRDLIVALSLIELSIDFSDEDIPEDVVPDVMEHIGRVKEELLQHIQGFAVAERVRQGFEVAIVGPPNIGKSTLLNRLAGRPAALTSEIAGTTRDVIEVRMDLGGLPVTFLDTAGIRETTDVVEGMGVSLGMARARQADLRVFLTDGINGPVFDPLPGDVVLLGKCDLCPDDVFGVSGLTGLGVGQLVERIQQVLGERVIGCGLIAHQRQLEQLEIAVAGLCAAEQLLLSEESAFDLVSEELRMSVRALEFLVGRVDVESLLDHIFSSFCLGK